MPANHIRFPDIPGLPPIGFYQPIPINQLKIIIRHIPNRVIPVVTNPNPALITLIRKLIPRRQPGIRPTRTRMRDGGDHSAPALSPIIRELNS